MQQFIRLLKAQEQGQGQEQPATTADLELRLAFCEFLAACTYTTLARAEDNQEAHVSLANITKSFHLLVSQLQYYLEVRKHCQQFRRIVRDSAGDLSGAAQDDILSKQLQVVKLELEASLKLQRYDDLEGLFEQCWNCKSSDRYETLADLVLVIHADLVKAGVQPSSQSSMQRAPSVAGLMLTLLQESWEPCKKSST